MPYKLTRKFGLFTCASVDMKRKRHVIQKLREDGWESLIEEVEAVCLKHEIDMNQKYVLFLLTS
jgi:uncharacterized cysteine cluster protein YcgN (CxxCxxCC family)